MEAEIASQPQILAEQAPRYLQELSAIVNGKQFQMVLLAARGSSDHAALYARYLLEIHLQIPVVLAAPSVITKYKANVTYPNCLAIGISQSGAAPDVAEVLENARKQGHTTLAITNTANSRITQAAEFTLDLQAGPEQSIAATKTYTASLTALYQLTKSFASQLPELITPTEEWLQLSQAAAIEAASQMANRQPLFSLARGYSFASACETALKIIECAQIVCKPYSSADFQHGPKALACENSCAICFGDLSAIENLPTLGILAPKPPVPEVQQPIWEIFFSQSLALELARQKGVDPDAARNLKKVTQTR